MIEDPTAERELRKPRRYFLADKLACALAMSASQTSQTVGPGFHTQGLAIVPLTFELSFDNLRRKCRLVWRKGNFFGVAFENQSTSTYIETNSDADVVIPGPGLLALNDPPQLGYLDNADVWPEFTLKVIDRKTQRRVNLRLNWGRHRTSSTCVNRHECLHCNDRRSESELITRRVHFISSGLHTRQRGRVAGCRYYLTPSRALGYLPWLLRLRRAALI